MATAHRSSGSCYPENAVIARPDGPDPKLDDTESRMDGGHARLYRNRRCLILWKQEITRKTEKGQKGEQRRKKRDCRYVS